MKRLDGKRNITTILHDLKTSYAQAFHEPCPRDASMEDVLIKAAREVKKRKNAEWYVDDKGQRRLKLTKWPARRDSL